MSLETPVGTEENSYLGDFIEDDTMPGPVDAASEQLLKEQMQTILGWLSERERKVLEMRFGLKDGRATRWKRSARHSASPASASGRSKPRRCASCAIPIRSRKLRDYLS